ncbi:MAG: type II secretion system protein M [Proteobacteria bacterium]|nr:type II secretion system protein M [Pseudomonadota bacterium]
MAIQMSNREKYFVGFAASLITVFVVYQFMITPFMDGKERKKRLITEKKLQLDEMRELGDEYRALVEKTRSIQAMSGDKDMNFTLFSFLEKLSGSTGVKENISYMKPSTTVQKDTQVELSLVEMKLQNVDLKKLVQFLYEVETSPNGVFIRGISLTKTGKDKKLLTAILQIETVKQES